ncbi:aminotransferase class I/II-fold pyridoxal phosphate-dependent enzyme, partial [Rhodobacterales bacterium HKCCE3408]|nr:aminotransferase class I/II-fold pyridoxal phosphate-dependent enzyme [Rhodobacterales bacterium HKCCE3408]
MSVQPETTASGTRAGDFYGAGSPDLLDRWSPVADWVWEQADAGLLVQPRVAAGAPGRMAAGLDASGRDLAGIDFARRDHLNFSSRPEVIAAAKDALNLYGPHAAGPAASAGLTRLTLALEARIAEFLSLANAVMFPDGWSAALATLRALVRPGDRVLVGPRPPAGVADGAALAGAALHRLEVTSPALVDIALQQARADAPAAGLLVVVQASDDGRGALADLVALQAICNRHRATLMVDVTGDLGLLGPSGRGVAELQGVLGAIDVVTGCLAPVFASSAGFAASGHAAFKDALRFGGGPQAAAPALAPVEAAAAMAALDLSETDL